MGYNLKDHLANAGVSFGKTSAGALEIVNSNNYYPFGMNHLKSGNSYFGAGSYKAYKYNGKELQKTDMYDYGTIGTGKIVPLCDNCKTTFGK